MVKRLLCVLAAMGAATAGTTIVDRRSGIRGFVQDGKSNKHLPVNVLERRTKKKLPKSDQDEEDEEARQLAHESNGYPDDYYRPCTYYYTKKSKFNDYDDDWYDDCKTESAGPPSQHQQDLQQDTIGGPAPTPFPTLALPPFLFDPTWEDEGAAALPPGTFALPTRPPSPTPTARPTFRPTGAPIIPPSPAPTLQPTPRPTAFPTDSPESSGASDSSIGVPTFPPKGDEVVEDGAVDDNEDDDAPPDINDTPPPFQADDEEADAACEAAQRGEVYTSTVSYTVIYQYELLTSMEADWTKVVWPAVDAAFGQFVAREMVQCDDDEEEAENVVASTSTTSNKLVQGVSPDPRDSFGTYDGSASNNDATSSCTNLQDFDRQTLICDTVTGSITVYFDEAEYMNQKDVNQMHLQVQNAVYRLLREVVNDEERRLQQLRGGEQRQMKKSDFIDENNGIYGLYFVSEPTEVLATGAGGPSLTDSIQNPTVDGGSESEQTLEASSRNVTPAVAASVAGLTMFVMLGVAFVIHRNRKASDEELTDTTFVKPIQTRSLSLDGSEFDNHESPVYENREEEEEDLPMQTMNTTTDSDSFPIQESPNPFRDYFSVQEQKAPDPLEPVLSHSRSRRDISRSPHDLTNCEESDAPRRLSFSNQACMPSSTREVSTNPEMEEAREETPNSFRPSPESRPFGETPNTAHRTMYTVEETVGEDKDFDYSRDGISMRLTSPELMDSNVPVKAFQPILRSPRAMSYERDPPEEQKEHCRLQSQELKILSSFLTNEKDDSPSKASSTSMRSPGTPLSEKWTTRTISVGNSASTSLILRAANQVLKREEENRQDGSSTVSLGPAYSVDPSDGSVVSLGSSVEPPPSITPSAISATPFLNGHMSSSNMEIPVSRGFSISQFENEVPSSARIGRSSKLGNGLSFISPESLLASRTGRKPVEKSPESFVNLQCENTSTPKSLPRLDPPGSSESSRMDPEGGRTESSPESQGSSSSSRSEYLKSRRRAMEERFHNYKSRLSDSMLKEGGSNVTLLDEFRSKDCDRYSIRDEYSEDGTANKRCFDLTGDSDKEVGAFPKPQEERKSRSAVQQSPRRRRSRTPKKTKSKHDYTSLNDIEDLLDQDQEWRHSNEDESMRIDAFVSTRSRAASVDETMPEECKTLESMLESSPSYTPRMETRIYPQYTPDTVQL